MRRPMASPLFGARGRCNGAGVLQSRRARDGLQAGEPASFLGLRPGLQAHGAGDLADPERQQATGVREKLAALFCGGVVTRDLSIWAQALRTPDISTQTPAQPESSSG